MSAAQRSSPADVRASQPRSPREAALDVLLDQARQQLIDTGARNRLVHTNRKAKRPSTLTISSDDPDRLFQRLVHKSAGVHFRSDPRASARAAEDDAQERALPIRPKATGKDESVLQTRLAEETLQKRLLKFLRDAKTLEEEQGINILFLALGFLRWYEDENSEVLRESPLILVPVSLSRDPSRAVFRAHVRDEELFVNLPLAERLKDDGVALPSLPEEDGWLPSEYFNAVQNAIGGKPRWSIDRDGIELGFFSFAKLLMFHDLSGASWPDATILNHPLLNGLLADGFPSEEPLFPTDAKIDEIFAPEEFVHIVDADGSQALAIEAVRANRNLVIQGPPGTGKSQTIANIIAAAVHDGKSVLFVAEKLEALKVVRDILNKVGLADVYLELHSRAASKRLLAEELARTLESVSSAPPSPSSYSRLKQVRDDLNSIDDALHRPLRQSGESAYSALGSLIHAAEQSLPPPRLELQRLTEWGEDAFARVVALAAKLGRLLERICALKDHPWRGVCHDNLQPFELVRVRDEATRTLRAISDLDEGIKQCQAMTRNLSFVTLAEVRDFAALLGQFKFIPGEKLDIVQHLARTNGAQRQHVSAVAQEGDEIAKILNDARKVFADTHFQGDLSGMRHALSRGTSSWIARHSKRYRQASLDLRDRLSDPRKLPKAAHERVAFAERLIELRLYREAIRVHMVREAHLFGSFWQFEETDFGGFIAACAWLNQTASLGTEKAIFSLLHFARHSRELVKLGEMLQERTVVAERLTDALIEALKCDRTGPFAMNIGLSLSDLITRISGWRDSTDRYGEWVEFREYYLSLTECGAGEVAAAILDGRLTPALAGEELTYARAEALWKVAVQEFPRLKRQLGDERSSLVQDFQQLETRRRQDVVALVRAKHAASIPRGATGEMAVIRGEIARRRGHMAIRKLVQKAGSTLQKIKPVFLMSPISVAQYLEPGAVTFDLAVVDEASQVRPEDALGVCARAKQVVIVGDKHQLPPTGFFARLLRDGNDGDADGEDDEDGQEELNGAMPKSAARAIEMESILTLCEARGLPNRMLRWHYRSRHPSLIKVSNIEFYQSQLLLPPSPNPISISDGFSVCRVDGAYGRGGSRTNAIEGQAVVEAMVAHGLERPKETLGVVTFSVAQRDLILSLVDERRHTDAQFDKFLASSTDEVFVKNLENVQGDQRDAILISVGYGPKQAGGRLDSMNFGPVSTEGGERRLNVLFTRARTRCQVFVSFDSGDIDRSRTDAEGARVLQRFLAFAESGTIDQPEFTNADFDSPFEEDVAKAIHSLGFHADSQVGSAGFKIDLGVRHPEKPGSYILAVECDGATYHSAAWARERDRHRQEILQGMGWTFHRIWSTDWFYRRDAEMKRLKAALASAHASVLQSSLG